MTEGLLAGLFLGLDTVILGFALSLLPFPKSANALFLAPFLSTFLHDLFSSIWIFLYTGVRKGFSDVLRSARTRSGKFIMLAALLAGPIGMSGYIFSIKYIGAGYTAILSSLFPGVGAFLSYVFLKEKMKTYQIMGLAVSIAGVIGLGYTPEPGNISRPLIGYFFAFMCVFGWASEAVIIAYGFKDSDISDEDALLIRQVTSTLFYGFIIVPLIKGISETITVVQTSAAPVILFSALFGTISYLFYYKSIAKIGPSKAMALNITYSAWSVFFGFVLLKEKMSFLSILFALLVVGGSIIAGMERDMFIKRQKTSIE